MPARSVITPGAGITPCVGYGALARSARDSLHVLADASGRQDALKHVLARVLVKFPVLGLWPTAGAIAGFALKALGAGASSGILGSGVLSSQACNAPAEAQSRTRGFNIKPKVL